MRNQLNKNETMDVEQYLKAGTRENTRRSYQSAIEHFEVSWGGLLPATSNSIAQYLAHYGALLSLNTLKQRLAALAQWHLTQGFPDPTKTPLVRQVLKGIRATHSAPVQQARPLALVHLEQTVNFLAQESLQDARVSLRDVRDTALLLLGFWRGFRSDELCRLRVEHIQITEQGTGMQIYLPYSKGDRHNQGQTYHVPALKWLCPVQAYQNWLHVSGLQSGSVFQGINRWGQLSGHALHVGSLITVLRRAFRDAGIESDLYSSHSLRRGFATWAIANGWDMKALMNYVGWKDLKSALRYVDSGYSFGELAITHGQTQNSIQSIGSIESKSHEI